MKQLVTCPEDGLALIKYPWKQQLRVSLDELHPIDIDIWTKQVCNYYVYVPQEITPIIENVKGYGLQNKQIKTEPAADKVADMATDDLLDHATALINKAKSLANKPVTRKHSKKQENSCY